MKKAMAFVFMFGIGASYAFAVTPECRAACYAELAACVDRTHASGLCGKIYEMCLDDCE